MSFYEDKILPHVIHCACSLSPIMSLREKVVPLAYGNVLEIGIGSAVNMSLYDPDKVNMVWGLEPSDAMRQKAAKNIANSPVPVEWLSLPGEKIPLEDNSVDSVVITYALCTIPDWQTALKQIHRVLKDDGKIFFCEHGQAPDESVQKWQNNLNGVWSKLAGGCNLNRPAVENIQNNGFSIDWSDSNYMKGAPKFAAYISYGVATKVATNSA
ncbi:class I SAM-dependent methyltransferase [Leucothrix arctica]|uniref:SAM-dependent methyltransferase n=1 Tax=Leucothrix arctica TaxID=1481894 RepID=A0A317C4H8_9GAMM|nr:class I SAM-dependent methyltransferase [Leucothrix arctica]PWQ93488.1 SAM-dependent methyltransferase [Leucothrix arctica]